MATTSGERLTVTATAETEIVMTRVFNAPRRLVFDAWTRPELLRRWFGPRDWRLVECEIDLRPGGSYRYLLRGPGGAVMGMRGVYREIVPPERLVCTEVFDDFPPTGSGADDVALITARLTEVDGKTTWTATIAFPSQETRDAIVRSGMERGAGESYDRLSELLEGLSQGRPQET